MNLRKFARDKECSVRIYGHCNGDSATVVLAHIRRANVAGYGQKPPDLVAVLACSGCHDAIDGRVKTEYTAIQMDSYILHGMCRTLALIDKHYKIVPK